MVVTEAGVFHIQQLVLHAMDLAEEFYVVVAVVTLGGQTRLEAEDVRVAAKLLSDKK